MTAKRYDVIDEDEPRGQSVTYDGIPCTARTCVTRLNRLTEENEQLKQFKDKFYNIIDKRIRVLEHDYNQAVKNGMPSNSVYSEMELLEELKEEMDHI